jgi:uncharacterized protein
MQSPHGSKAAELFAAHLALVTRDMPAWLELFAEHAVIEFPYAPSVGTPVRLEGKAAITAYARGVPSVMQELVFTNLRTYPTQAPQVLWAEVHGEATITRTGLRYAQDYVMYLETDGERIVRYREYWDPVPVLQAFGGLQGVQQSLQAGGRT